MQQFLQIRDRLLEAVDHEYNVVDMDGVLRVLSELETFHITKEALEATRLGKHINEVRRRASDKYLASRAKNLVKKWRQLLVSSNHTASPAQSPAMAPSSTAISSRLPLRHPALENCVSMPSSANTSPALAEPKASDKGNDNLASVSLPVSPYEDSRSVSKTHAANKRLRKDGNSNHSCSDPDISLSPTLVNGSSRSPLNNNNNNNNSNGATRSNSGLSNAPTSFSGLLEPRSTRGRPKNVVPDVLGQQMEVVRRSSSSKVRTTQEIVRDLVKKSTSPGLNSVVRKVAATAASSRSNSSSPSMVNVAAGSEAVGWKSESSDNEEELVETPVHERKVDVSDSDSSRSRRKRKRPKLAKVSDANPCDELIDSVMQKLPPLDRDAVLQELRETATSSSEDEADMEGLVPVKRPEVEDSFVDAVLNSELEQCNGNVDDQGQFRDWSEVLTRPTANEETLFALPYCIID